MKLLTADSMVLTLHFQMRLLIILLLPDLLSGKDFISRDKRDLRLMGMVFKKNGEVIATGAGAAVMGHPARAIAWMANRLIKVGQSIQPGEVVLSGSLSEAFTIAPGDHFSASFDGIGSLEAVFTE